MFPRRGAPPPFRCLPPRVARAKPALERPRGRAKTTCRRRGRSSAGVLGRALAPAELARQGQAVLARQEPDLEVGVERLGLPDLPVLGGHEALLLGRELDGEILVRQVEVGGERLDDAPLVIPVEREGGGLVLPVHAVEGEEPGELALRGVRKRNPVDAWERGRPLRHLPLRGRSTAGFDGRIAGLAEGTVLRLVRGHRERGQRRFLHGERRGPTASIDQRADTHQNALAVLDDLDDLARGAAGRDDVFNHEAALARCEAEASAEAHHAVLALAEEAPGAEGPRYLVGHEDPADGRRQDHLDAVALEGPGQLAAERLRVGRMLEDERALEIDVGVEPGREEEMAAEEAAGALVALEDFLLRHALAIAPRMAVAAALGSGALVIGLPTTR